MWHRSGIHRSGERYLWEGLASDMEKLTQVAVLDDYQGVALALADWTLLEGKAEVTVFGDHLSDPAAVVERLKPFDVVCVMRERTPLRRSTLEELPQLKLIVTTAAHNVSIDMAAAAERGITVCGTRSTSHGTTELTWALILSLVRKLPGELASMRVGGWQVALGGELEGKTIGIAGFGKIGVRVAKVAHAFGMNILAWSQNLTREAAEQHGAQLATKERLFRESDIVTLHMILSPRTQGLVGTNEIQWMKPSAYLVNTSRAGLVDNDALIDALEKGAIAGAALDVYDTEPLPAPHPFRTLENVLATPHIGFVSELSYQVFYRDTVEDILEWLAGNPVRVLGNPKRS
jgi:phosphoglycerate dehydrogenase-like enzyme